jgi:hypothetical protein
MTDEASRGALNIAAASSRFEEMRQITVASEPLQFRNWNIKMKVFSLKILFGASFVALLAASGAHAAPVAGIYEITVKTNAVDGSAPPAVKFSPTTGAPGQQWKWDGAKFMNIQSGRLLADNGNGAPTQNSSGDTFKLLVAGSGWNIVDTRTGNYLGIVNGTLSFNMNQKSSWIFTSVPSEIITSDGTFSFGTACTGTDCPAAQYHVVVNNVSLPNASGICLRAAAGVRHPYLMDGYGEWSQWSPSAKAFVSVAAPGVPCSALPYSADGSTLSTPGSGTLVTAAGTWSLGTAMCGGAYQTLLNSSQAGGGCGDELLVAKDGNMFTKDAGGNWWEWINGGWTNLNTTTTP